jgi:RNA polymerase sigma factor (sigma-70 family)
VSTSDSDLVRRARGGDRAAFGCLIERHQPMMLRLCRRVLATTDGLEDIAQETALQAMLSLDTLRDPTRFGAWLAGIGLHVAQRARRYSAHDAWSWEALLGGRLEREPIDSAPDVEELTEAAELSARVRAAVAELPVGQRSAILLVYLSGLTYRETAAALGIEIGSLKTRLYKGRERLRRRLRDLWTEEQMTTSLEQEFVEMHVADVRRRPAEDDRPPRYVVVLEELGTSRQVPIWIGQWEGDSIAMLLEKVRVARPLTHALTASLLRAAGVRVREVRVNCLVDETFYAQIVLKGPNGPASVDARPSDAIALAIEAGVSIFVASDVVMACDAQRPNRLAEPISVGIGAAEIVRDLIDRWPTEPKPLR